MKPNKTFSKLLTIQFIVSLFSISIFLLGLFFFQDRLKDFNKTRMAYKRFFDKSHIESKATLSIRKVQLPKRLKNIPFGEEDHLVLRTKRVSIRNVIAPYNASIIKYKKGYLMCFRYDIPSKHTYSSHIGCVKLDAHFNQMDQEFKTIDTGFKRSEDPRIFSIGQEVYLLYSTSEFLKYFLPFPFISTVNVSKLDVNKCKLQFTTSLELNLSLTEKNWVPFEYVDAQNHPHFYLQYSVNPHKILHLPDPKVNHILHSTLPKSDSLQLFLWENKHFGWGSLRGGTPALKIGDEYLAFFHSCFQDSKGLVWYNMGAYTFEAHPPFRITSISPYPILFKGIYSSISLNAADPQRYVIFPVGFVIEEEEGKEIIHLSCGENDSSIKIITLDKAKLLKTMQKI